MTRDEALPGRGGAASTVARDLVADGARLLVTGDMGIANTTASAALVSALTGLDPAAVTGRGTGVDDAALAHKVEVVRQALAVNHAGAGGAARVLAARRRPRARRARRLPARRRGAAHARSCSTA